MKFKNEDAILLERITRYAHSCEKDGLGGVISTVWFADNPFDAALVALAPLWKHGDYDEIHEFLYRWEPIIRGSNSNNEIALVFIQELRKLVHRIKDQES